MRLFWEITRRSFHRQMAYRAANLAGLMTNLFFGILRASVLIALYAGQPEVNEISVAGAVTYTGLTQAVIAYLSIFGWYDLMNTVHTGEIANDLLKPIGLFRYWLAVDLGRAGASLITRGLLLMAAYTLIYRITLPATWQQWLAFVVSLILAWMVSFAWRFMVNLTAFWSTNAVGIGRFCFMSGLFLSGFFMPLRFFPAWFQQLAYLTPFPAMINVVIEVYLGVVTAQELWAALGLQVAWFIALVGLGQLILHQGIRRLVIQGG